MTKYYRMNWWGKRGNSVQNWKSKKSEKFFGENRSQDKFKIVTVYDQNKSISITIPIGWYQ